MKYISVGAVVTPATEKIYTVSHSGYNFSLVGESARMWLSGRYGFSHSENIYEEKALRQLLKMGLVVPVDDLPSGEYRALTHCTIVPAKKAYSYFGLSHRERTVLKWLREAGLTLTMGELVFLMERKISPLPELLGTENQQRLVETIYTKENIFDNILENQMERASARNETVRLVMKLLRKKRIVLL